MRKPIPYLCFIVVSLIISSCASLYKPSYIGRSYPPTSSVDIFFRERDINKEYEIIGTIKIADMQRPSTQRSIENMAKEKGADAIIFITEIGNRTVVESKNDDDNCTEIITNSPSDGYIRAYCIKYK